MDKKPVAKHVQETHSEGSLWKKPWRKAPKKAPKGQRVQHSRISLDQHGLCNEDESWQEYRAYLFNQMPSLSSAAKAAFSLGTALVSVPAAEILEPPKLLSSSSINLPSKSQNKSETRLKTLEEEAVSAALAAAAATAAAAAERARIAAQAALAMQAEQEREAAKANEEARLARETAILEEKSSRQGGLSCSLLSKRRRPTKTRVQRASIQQPQSYSSELFSKRDSNAPIHSRPPPPMVSPRFAARLVELISSASPVSVPQYPLSKPTQPKRASVNRPSRKGQTSSPQGTGSASSSLSSSGRSQTSSAAKPSRPPQQQPTPSNGRQPSSPPPVPYVNHAGVPTSPPTLPAHSNVQPGQQPVSSRAGSSVPANSNQPPPANHPPQAQSPQVLQTSQAHQSPLVHQETPQSPPSTHQTPQPPPPKTPVQHPYSPPPPSKPSLPPPYHPPPKPLVQCPFSTPPPKPLVQSPFSPPPLKPLIQPSFSPPPLSHTLPYQPPPPYSYGTSTNIRQGSSPFQTLSQPPPPVYTSNQSYQPASHMYGTLPRKHNTQALNPTTPEFTPQATTMAQVTIAMLPNTASTQNQWSQQPPSDPTPSKPRSANQRPSATRTSVGALLRSGIRSLGKNSVSAAALDRPKTETSVAWNTTKMAAPADESVPSSTEQRILPPSDLSENDSTVWFHQTSSQPSIPWSTAWQNPPALPVYNEGRTQQKQDTDSWQQETYKFALDMNASVPQTIYEVPVDQSSSLGSLPQTYMPMDTLAPDGTDWWSKDPTEQKTRTWHKNVSVSLTPAHLPQSSPLSQRTVGVPSNLLPPSRSPIWQNQLPGDEKDKKQTEGIPNQAIDNSAKVSFQESMYQQAIFQCDYQQVPSLQQHYPETVVEEASTEETL